MDTTFCRQYQATGIFIDNDSASSNWKHLGPLLYFRPVTVYTTNTFPKGDRSDPDSQHGGGIVTESASNPSQRLCLRDRNQRVWPTPLERDGPGNGQLLPGASRVCRTENTSVVRYVKDTCFSPIYRDHRSQRALQRGQPIPEQLPRAVASAAIKCREGTCWIMCLLGARRG